jgi:acetyltransferase-like isoleucine patch superfamily enzyme
MRSPREILREAPRSIGYYRGPRLMSSLRRRWVLLRHPHANVQIDPSAYLGPGFSLHIPGPGTFIAGPGSEFRRGFRCEIEGRGRVSVGAETRFTYNVLMQCTTTIDIGERCVFGQSTMIVDGNHRFRDYEKPMLAQGYDYSPIEVGDDAAIMTKCTIIASIGTRAFIGANSVVTKPVPAYTVTVGAPARPIEYFGPPGQEPAELPAKD